MSNVYKGPGEESYRGENLRGLACAIILRAAIDYHRYDLKTGQGFATPTEDEIELHSATLSWFLGIPEVGVTFAQCCDVLGWEPFKMRGTLLHSSVKEALVSSSYWRR